MIKKKKKTPQKKRGGMMVVLLQNNKYRKVICRPLPARLKQLKVGAPRALFLYSAHVKALWLLALRDDDIVFVHRRQVSVLFGLPLELRSHLESCDRSCFRERLVSGNCERIAKEAGIFDGDERQHPFCSSADRIGLRHYCESSECRTSALTIRMRHFDASLLRVIGMFARQHKLGGAEVACYRPREDAGGVQLMGRNPILHPISDLESNQKKNPKWMRELSLAVFPHPTGPHR